MRRDVLRLEAALAEARAEAIREGIAAIEATVGRWPSNWDRALGAAAAIDALRALLPNEEQA